MSNPDFIPFAKPAIGDDEIAAVVKTLEGGWLTMGPRTQEFQLAFAEAAGAKRAVAVNSCTAALHLALVTHDIGPDDEVIVPSLTFAATANVVEHVGATPVFADVEEDSWNVSVATLEAALSTRTRAVICVHFAGLPCDLEPIRTFCEERKLVLVEDAAHAAGATYRGRPIGADTAAACFSFYANKNMTTGEGGMLTTDDEAIADRAETLRLHGMSRDAWKRYSAKGKWRYDIVEPGFKCNTTDLNSALGLVQLQRLESFTEVRARLVEAYRAELNDVPWIEFQATAPSGSHSAHHLCAARIGRRGGPDREAVMQALRDAGVGSSVHFSPLHLMSHYSNKYGYERGSLPTTEALGDQLLSLPLFVGLQDSALERVVAALQSVSA